MKNEFRALRRSRSLGSRPLKVLTPVSPRTQKQFPNFGRKNSLPPERGRDTQPSRALRHARSLSLDSRKRKPSTPTGLPRKLGPIEIGRAEGFTPAMVRFFLSVNFKSQTSLQTTEPKT